MKIPYILFRSIHLMFGTATMTLFLYTGYSLLDSTEIRTEQIILLCFVTTVFYFLHKEYKKRTSAK
jgi:hypothetical protein